LTVTPPLCCSTENSAAADGRTETIETQATSANESSEQQVRFIRRASDDRRCD
jgi:hypothetical protein